jgi:hypothetical protein
MVFASAILFPVRAAVIPLLVLASSPLRSAEFVEADVTHAEGRYRLRFEVQLAAEPAKVRRLLTDYDHLDRLSSLIVKSRRLTDGPNGAARVHQALHACVLFLCRSAQRVLEVETADNGDILTRTDPSASDFEHGEETWQILAEGRGTRLRYRASLTPTFFIPPFIGPWLLKGRLREELDVIAERIEARAARQGRRDSGFVERLENLEAARD